MKEILLMAPWCFPASPFAVHVVGPSLIPPRS